MKVEIDIKNTNKNNIIMETNIYLKRNSKMNMTTNMNIYIKKLRISKTTLL